MQSILKNLPQTSASIAALKCCAHQLQLEAERAAAAVPGWSPVIVVLRATFLLWRNREGSRIVLPSPNYVVRNSDVTELLLAYPPSQYSFHRMEFMDVIDDNLRLLAQYSIRHLRMIYDNVSVSQSAFAYYLQHVPRLTSVTIEGRGLPHEALDDLAGLSYLTTLKLRACNARDSTVKKITLGCSSLMRLEITSCDEVSNAGVKPAAELETLRFLCVRQCRKLTGECYDKRNSGCSVKCTFVARPPYLRIQRDEPPPHL